MMVIVLLFEDDYHDHDDDDYDYDNGKDGDDPTQTA